MGTQTSTSSQDIQDLYFEFLKYLDTKPGNDIPGILIDIESKIKALLEGREYLSQKYGENRDSVERKIMHKITGDSVNIGNLLETLAKKVQEILKKSPEEIDREMGIFVKELSGVVLPPGAGNRQEGDGNSESKEEKELTESRYGKILEILRENEIYADDIIVYTAQLQKNQMRQTSYRVIQIPRLSKTIFVCDEYGEASFVVDSLVYPEVFLEHTKSDIREKLSATRIIHSLAWEIRMLEALFGTLEERKACSASEKTQTQKIDVRKMEEYREEILRQFPSPEDFMNQHWTLRTKGISGIGITQLGSIFGINGRIEGNLRLRAALGRKIYGVGYDSIECEFWDLDNWREYIKREHYSTPQLWMKAGAGKVNTKVFIRKKINAIARLFGVDGDIGGSIKLFALLGQRIYGTGYEIIDNELLDIDFYKKEIQIKTGNPIVWMKMKVDEKRKYSIRGKGLHYIAGLFGLKKGQDGYKGNPVNLSGDMALLGQKIYGDHLVFQEYLKEDITENWTEENWREEILKKFPIPENWMSLTRKQKRVFEIQGKGLKAISTIFGISCDPVGYSRDMALLGEKIYGSFPVFDRYIQKKE